MRVQTCFRPSAFTPSKAPETPPGEESPKDPNPQDAPPPLSFEEFYAPQRRKELVKSAIPLYGAYHNLDRAVPELFPFGNSGGWRIAAALSNLAGTAGLALGHFPLGAAGLAASVGFTYLHQHYR